MDEGEKDPHYDRVAAKWDGTDLVIRASALGGCPKALGYALSGQAGEEPPPPMQGAMDESAALEQQAVDLWLDAVGDGVGEVVDGGSVWVRLAKNVVLEGTTDAALIDGDDAKVIEVKCLGEQLWSEWRRTRNMEFDQLPDTGLMRKYRVQAAVYGLASNGPVVMVVARKEHGALSGEVDSVVWSPGSEMLPTPDQMRKMALQVLAGSAQVDGGDLVCREGWTGWCPYQGTCRDVVALDDEVDRLIGERKKLKTMIDELGNQLRRVNADLHQSLNGAKSGVTPSGAKVTWVEQDVPEHVVKASHREYVKVTEKKEKGKR